MSSFSTFLSSPQPPAHLDRAITLPALLSLTLEWQQPMFVGHLLKHLRLPGPTKIDITYGLDTDQNIWNARLSADDKLLPPAGHDSIHTLSSAHTLRVTGKRMGSSFSWYTGLDAVPTNNGHIRSEPALTIQLCGRRSSECLVAHFARTHRGRPPFSLVHTLAVGGRKIGISSQADWAGLFSAMPQLRTLHLAVYPAHVLVCLRALCPLPVEEDGTEEDDALDQRSEVNEEVLGQFCTVEFV
ncbi:uncharacterized protein B0H18DRAFT_1119055 [Fomitopsis serialis]|uniref:uncharacterized protein n=1 Tax=Fomitopsis serialis TaxID=139415 RepID=UPI0020081E19|nr:uncharacterized protein B0H18DRAFT_1119055 [Neoantrodia serialis]KAH9926157.1 hypothetical protein B0H18DRAFT_1119055 [Neoantrodia serialis]